MEEQTIWKWFIVFLVFALIWLFVYLTIHNNWFGIDYYLSDVPNFDTNVVNNGIQNKEISFVFDNISKYLTVWEYTDFTVEVIEKWEIFKNYEGTIIFLLVDEDWNLLDPDYYIMSNNWRYDFKLDDNWKKIFVDGLKIDKVWKYTLFVESLFEEWAVWSFDIVVQEKN